MFNMSDDTKKLVNELWEKLDRKLSKTAERNQDHIPYTAIDGDYHKENPQREITWWTNGFWSGLMWLMYVGTNKEIYKETANKGEILLDEAFRDFDGLHHDVGFMWHISSGVNYKLTGNHYSKVRSMIAVSLLSSRYNLNGKFIRAWNGDKTGWAIIDCMMNIPLLYWASRETNDPRFRYIAESHADTTMENHVRPDGSVNHILAYDPINGGMVENIGGQGMYTGSSWSRGQAWALYGFVLSYIHTNKQEYLDTAKKVAHYFIANVYDDWLPKCDFRSPNDPTIYDTTAGACAACGLIEIARVVPEFEKELYLNAAINMIKSMNEKFCDWDENRDSILQMGTERYPNDANPSTKGVHIPIIYGDYYFAEAIYKLKGFDILFW